MATVLRATTTQTEKYIDAADRRYWRDINNTAAWLRVKYVIPLCNARRWRFVGGMGTWSFTAENGTTQGALIWERDDRQLPKRVSAALSVNVINGQEIGSLVPDYTPKGWKGKG